MKLESLFYNKRLIKLLLSEEEIKELLERIENFGRTNLIIEDSASGRKNYRDEVEQVKDYWVQCPCGSYIGHHSFYSFFRLDEKGEIKPSDLTYARERAFESLMVHIIYHIRMNGSEVHINLLRLIYGDKVTIALLENWAKKNMIVALKLKMIVEDLKRLSNIEVLPEVKE